MAECYPDWYVSDNSFLSQEMMDTFHSPIIELARQLLCEPGSAVVDLGCGNGALLKSIHRAVPHSVPYGVDCNSDRIGHAQILLPEFADHMHHGNLLAESEQLWCHTQRFVIAILMPGHLLSAPPARVNRLKKRLVTRCQYVITYCYQDWLLRYHSLEALAWAAGLIVRPVFTSDLVATALLERVSDAT